jgi:hypothetical protein
LKPFFSNIIAGIVITFSFSQAFAHADHSLKGEGPIKLMAEMKVDDMAAKGKIDSSWKGAKAKAVNQRENKKTKEWVVIFSNSTEADESKKTLYVFYTLRGEFVAANFSGK